MIEKIYEGNVLLLIIAVLCGISVFVRLALSLRYRSLIKEAALPGGRKRNRYSRVFVERIVDKFAYEYKKSYFVNNVSIFVDKYIYEVKMLGIRSSTWESFEILSVIVCLVAGSLGAYEAYYYKEEAVLLIRCVLEGLIAAGIVIVSDALFDLSGNKLELHTTICNYLENYMKPRLERGEYNSFMIENVKMMDEVDQGMLELIDSMDHGIGENESVEPECIASEIRMTGEDDKIIEDVIKEYLT